MRTTAADALHQSSQPCELPQAHNLFEAAETLQREDQPEFDLLYSLQGFKYCDLILAPAERGAWHGSHLAGRSEPSASSSLAAAELPQAARTAEHKALRMKQA